jgi:hypothetical protein
MRALAKHIFLVLVMAICIPNAHAQQKFVRGQGTAKDKKEALVAAKRSAWNNYKAEIDGAKLDNVMANEKILLENLDDLMIDVTVTNEECKSGDGCTIRIKATVNENQIESKLRSIAKATGGKSEGVKKEGADDVAMLVMARVIDVKKTYDARVTKRKEVTVSTSGTTSSKDSADATDTGSQESMADSQSATQSTKSVTSGTTENKGPTLTYKPWSELTDLQNRVSEVLTINKIQISSWSELVADCKLPPAEKFSEVYAESGTGTLPDKMMADIISKLKSPDCGIGKFVIASITIDGTRKDADTGLNLATGNVNVQAIDITGRRSKQLGAANRNTDGRGSEEIDAQRKALEKSAKLAADAIINQVNLR